MLIVWRGGHLHERDLLPTEWLELELGLWNDDGRRPFRNEIRRRVASEPRPANHWELMSLDAFEEHAHDHEWALDARA